MNEERKFIDLEGIAMETYVTALRRREAAYRLVFYTTLSPRELDEDLVIKLDMSEPKTQEEKRAVKLTELDTYKAACLKAYNELCDIGMERFDFTYLIENGFGLGVGDFMDDEDIDKLIAKDEEIIAAKKGIKR
jgi:hypothetical protein